MTTLNPVKFGIAVGVAIALINAGCAIAVAFAPDMTIGLFNTFAHGIDLSRVASPGRSVGFIQALGGTLVVGAVGVVAGSTIAVVYNAMQH